MTHAQRSTRGTRLPAEFAVWGALIAALVLFGVVAIGTYRSTARLPPVLAEVERTREIARRTSEVLRAFQEAQSERRAYLLSGDTTFVGQYEEALAIATREVAVLERLSDGDTLQQTRVRRLAHLIARSDTVARLTIDVRRTRGLEAAAALVRSGAFVGVAADVERVARAVNIVDQERLDAALDLARSRALQAQRIAVGSALFALLLLPPAAVFIWRDLMQRRVLTRELHHASRDAEAATRAKSEFLASMSHEIRTPLNGVIGMTELALDTELTPTQRDYLTTARASAESLLRLLNDILDFSKIEAGRLDIEHTPFSVRDLFGETLRTLALRAEQKKLELAFRVLPSVPDILIGDPGRLQQVVVNLVGNAIKFTERGEILVLVESQQTDAAEVTLRVSVRDTGIGIPQERTGAIFDLFSQADNSTTRRFGGTGLGLTISEQLVKLMGGSIWVESEVGQGSTFFFTARLGVGEQRTLPRASLEQLGGLRVLILDDHPTNRFILEEMLTHWHMHPSSAATAAEAIELARQARAAGAPFQAGVFDNLLPDSNGYDVAERLASAKLLPSSGVIILSSDNAPGSAARRATLGISRALMKPVKQSELLDAILMAVAGTGTASRVSGLTQGAAWDHARVLLVEDNAVNQRVAQGLLAKRKVDVTIAGNGREAVDLLERDPARFDLVLMDVEMPEMDGIEATRRIRAGERLRAGARIPIVAVTAHALQEERQRCEAAGMDMCITKPLRRHDLDEVLTRYLGPASVGNASRVPDLSDTESAILTLVDGDHELLRVISAEYLRQAPELVRGLDEAIQRCDAREVARLAHKLRGSSLQVGAEAVGTPAGVLEDEARAGDLARARARLDRMRGALAEFTQVITRLTGQ